MPSGHVESLVENARKVIENDIKDHYEAIIVLKRRLNDMAPISGLPNEILSEIFVHVARDSFDAASKGYHYADPRGAYPWLKVTHICHSWRLLAHNTPRLWSFLVLTQKSMMDELLPRSKKAPLHLATSNVYAAGVRDIIAQIFLSDSQRLKEFRACGPTVFICDTFAAATQPASILEKLVLLNPHFGGPEFYPEPAILPMTPFHGEHPRLRHLELHNIPFHWDNSILCSSLTKLVLRWIVGPDSPRPRGSFEQLLSSLERMTALQFLQLDDTLPDLPDGTTSLPSPSRTISLPRLRSMELHGKQLSSAHLLNHLNVPPDTSLRIFSLDRSESQPLLDVLKKCLNRSTPLRTIHISATYSETLSLDGWKEEVDFDTDQVAWISLAIRLPLRSLPAHIDMFSTLYSLEVSVDDQRWPWEELFAGMPQLRVLSLCDDLQETFLLPLSSVVETKEGAAPSLVLPNLQTLMLTDVRLLSKGADKPVEYLDDLVNCLILRCNHGCPLQELRLFACRNIVGQDIHRLEEVVPVVEWDGVEEFESDTETEEYDLYDGYGDIELYDDWDDDFYGYHPPW